MGPTRLDLVFQCLRVTVHRLLSILLRETHAINVVQSYFLSWKKYRGIEMMNRHPADRATGFEFVSRSSTCHRPP